MILTDFMVALWLFAIMFWPANAGETVRKFLSVALQRESVK